MKKYKTEQEDFWAGNFGSDYIKRRQDKKLLSANISMFSSALKRSGEIKNCIEFGANIGMNIHALKLLFPNWVFSAVEINKEASDLLKKVIELKDVYNESILDFKIERKWDLVLVKGVLIHVNPEELKTVYGKIFESCNRYVLIAEYYNPFPVTVNYRGNNDKLFKRDFAGEIMEAYPQMTLIDYGFVYHRDMNFPLDDVTWFLLEKKKT